MKISQFAVKHPAIVIIGLLSLLIFSAVSFLGTPVALIPDVDVPTYQVYTIYPGADAQRVNDEVTLILEKKLAILSSLTTLDSISTDSLSVINLEFSENIDADSILPIIRENINEVQADLPSGIDGAPYIIRMEASRNSAIFSFTMNSSMNTDEASLFVEDTIVPALSSIEGVAEVKVLGSKKNDVRITLNSGRIESLGLSVMNILQVISNNNISLPAGKSEYRGDNLIVETRGELRSLDSIANLLVGSHMGSSIYLGDVATIEMAPPLEDIEMLGDTGEQTLLLKMYRRTGEDVLDIIKETKEILNKIEDERSDIEGFPIVKDESRVTGDAVTSLSKSLLIGIALAYLVILLFLRDLRMALYIASSIPLSILFSLVGLKIFGLSLNILTLSGLTVAIGMVVDASIVIMENIHLHRQKGEGLIEASINGAVEMGSAVLASALTTISVFFPMLFLKGITGIFFSNIAITLILSLSASLIVSLIIIPFLSAHLSNKKKKEVEKKHPLMEKLSDAYRNALETTLKRKGFIFFFVIAVLIISVLSITTLGVTVFPSVDTGEIEVNLEYPPGYTLEQSKEKTLEIEDFIDSEIPELSTMVFEVEPAGAKGSLILISAEQRDRSTHEINQILTRRINSEIVNVKALLFNGGLDTLLAMATGGRGYIVDLFSPEWEELELASQTVADILQQDPQIYKVDNTAASNNLKLQFDLDPLRLNTLGLSAAEAGSTGNILYQGRNAGTFRDGEVLRDILLVSDLHELPLSEDSMNRMFLINPLGETISYNSFSEFNLEDTSKLIRRQNRLYHGQIQGYFFGEDITGISSRMNQALNGISFPSTVTRGTGGMAGMIQDELPPLLLVLGIAVFLVYAVMVIQFERFRQPLIIMAAYPFTLIGLVFGLNLFNSVLSMIAVLGVIALAGVVVNNAIIIVDYTNLLRREKGLSIREAILDGSRSRLQPILMTTLTTMLGVLPMALGRGNGAELYAPLGQVILGGMLTSTFITLFFVPTLYEYLETRADKKRINKS